jgi:hypothetical protein
VSGKAYQGHKKSYERTQHVIENKGHEFSEPSMYLKGKHLSKISQHVDDTKRVECSGGRDGAIFVRLEPALRDTTGAASAGKRARIDGRKSWITGSGNLGTSVVIGARKRDSLVQSQ